MKKSEIQLDRGTLRMIQTGNIRKYRDEKCYTQEYMANELGIGQSTYQKLETGQVKVSMDRLVQIANILGKSIKVFFGKEESENLETGYGNSQKSTISISELDFLKKTIFKQQNLINELEERLLKLYNEINQLKIK